MKYLVIICLAFLATAWVIERNPTITSIYGSIEPVEGGKKVFAIKGTDTVAVVPQDGKFSVAVGSAGNWKIYVQATPPYKDAAVNNIMVEEGKSSDVGIIKLTSDH